MCVRVGVCILLHEGVGREVGRYAGMRLLVADCCEDAATDIEMIVCLFEVYRVNVDLLETQRPANTYIDA